jgi:hypothetical protein
MGSWRSVNGVWAPVDEKGEVIEDTSNLPKEKQEEIQRVKEASEAAKLASEKSAKETFGENASAIIIEQKGMAQKIIKKSKR